jgi:hypothetical protein
MRPVQNEVECGQGRGAVLHHRAVEPKGGAAEDKDSFPAESVPPGGGCVLKQPNQNGRGEVSTYLWQQIQNLVKQGSGSGKTFTLKRGHVHRVTLGADKAGVFPISCVAHKPTMMDEHIVTAKKWG